jgi:predicted deacylase
MTASAEAYPIELAFPDLAVWARGHGGIPYVHSFDSGVPGPHVMVNALTHGNEVCGAIVVGELLAFGVRPRAGKLTLAFANVEAYLRFDPGEPDASRFVDQDFNRLWTRELLDDLSRDSCELRRARAMRPVIDDVDLLLDLHSMHERSAPLALSGPLGKGVEFARSLGAPSTIIVDAGHAEGRRLRDYAGFGALDSPRNALLIECGQHWEQAALTVARDCAARFLQVSGVLCDSELPAGWRRQSSQPQRVVRVTDAVIASSMDFRFTDNYKGLEVIPEAGSIVAWRDGQPVRTPYDDCVLVMPSLRQLRPGVTVVRFGTTENRADGPACAS